MFAVEFKTRIKNGTNKIPNRYRSKLSENVRVILFEEHTQQKSARQLNDAIEALLANPVTIPPCLYH